MKRFSLICLCITAVSCASVRVTPLNVPASGLEPRSADQVKVFLTKAPEQPYEEAYLIRADGVSSDQALVAMRERAGQLGCDGLVIAGQADRVVGTGDGQGATNVSTREGFVGSCIVFQ